MADEQKKPQVNATVKEKSVLESVGSYVFNQYIIPKSKDLTHDLLSGAFNMLNETIQGAINMGVYGEDKPRQRTTGTTTNYTSYYSRPQGSTMAVQSTRSQVQQIGQRASNEVKMIWVDTEQDAQNIVQGLADLIQQYGKAKVADLYEMLNPRPQIAFQDYKFGWIDISQISYRKEYTGEQRGRYFIDLPKPIDVSNI